MASELRLRFRIRSPAERRRAIALRVLRSRIPLRTDALAEEFGASASEVGSVVRGLEQAGLAEVREIARGLYYVYPALVRAKRAYLLIDPFCERTRELLAIEPVDEEGRSYRFARETELKKALDELRSMGVDAQIVNVRANPFRACGLSGGEIEKCPKFVMGSVRVDGDRLAPGLSKEQYLRILVGEG